MPGRGFGLSRAGTRKPRELISPRLFYIHVMLAILAALSVRPSISSVDLDARTAACGGLWSLRVSSSVSIYLETSQTVSRSGTMPGRVALWVEGIL